MEGMGAEGAEPLSMRRSGERTNWPTCNESGAEVVGGVSGTSSTEAGGVSGTSSTEADRAEESAAETTTDLSRGRAGPRSGAWTRRATTRGDGLAVGAAGEGAGTEPRGVADAAGVAGVGRGRWGWGEDFLSDF